ncbi:hypothetical protein ACVGX0_03940, partial [Enterobacter hormaechei]
QNTPPKSTGNLVFKVLLGLDALMLLRDKNLQLFLIFSFQFTNTHGFYKNFYKPQVSIYYTYYPAHDKPKV